VTNSSGSSGLRNSGKSDNRPEQIPRDRLSSDFSIGDRILVACLMSKSGKPKSIVPGYPDKSKIPRSKRMSSKTKGEGF
jgi:hypothetical protein